MATETTKTHPWHLVEPSGWPIFGGFSAFVAAVGGIIYMHSDFTIPWVFVIGMMMIMMTFWGWWRVVVNEAEEGGNHSSLVQTGLRIGVILFITSEIMFFFAFFWAYYHASLPILNNVAGPWPPAGIEALGAADVPILNTLILLTSSITVTIAHHALIEDDRQKLIKWTAITFTLGIIFLSIQVFEYYEATFKITEGIYPTTFYLATGFHGFHVFIGTIFLIVCYFRARAGHFKPDQHVGYEAAAWYWHFVDVVWIFLFINIYWWGASGFGHISAG